MVSGSVARRYAKAMLQIGIDEGNLERLGREVGTLGRAVHSSPDLLEVLKNPAFGRDDREKILRAVLERIGAAKTVVNFAHLLLDRERVAILPDIARELDALIDERAGRVAAQVTSAAPLDQAQKDKLKAALEAMSGKEVEMQVEHDPALLGGVVAVVGDVVYDGSLKTQLDKMRRSMAG